MKMRKVVSAMLVAAMATGMVAGCGSSSDSKSDKKDAKGKVYYLNQNRISSGRIWQKSIQKKQEWM